MQTTNLLHESASKITTQLFLSFLSFIFFSPPFFFFSSPSLFPFFFYFSFVPFLDFKSTSFIPVCLLVCIGPEFLEIFGRVLIKIGICHAQKVFKKRSNYTAPCRKRFTELRFNVFLVNDNKSQCLRVFCKTATGRGWQLYTTLCLLYKRSLWGKICWRFSHPY